MSRLCMGDHSCAKPAGRRLIEPAWCGLTGSPSPLRSRFRDARDKGRRGHQIQQTTMRARVCACCAAGGPDVADEHGAASLLEAPQGRRQQAASNVVEDQVYSGRVPPPHNLRKIPFRHIDDLVASELAQQTAQDRVCTCASESNNR